MRATIGNILEIVAVVAVIAVLYGIAFGMGRVSGRCICEEEAEEARRLQP